MSQQGKSSLVSPSVGVPTASLTARRKGEHRRGQQSRETGHDKYTTNSEGIVSAVANSSPLDMPDHRADGRRCHPLVVRDWLLAGGRILVPDCLPPRCCLGPDNRTAREQGDEETVMNFIAVQIAA